MQKLKHCLRTGDLPTFRRHFNLQSVHLRGLETTRPICLLPSQDTQGPDGQAVTEFLHQNGFRSVGEVDSAGWRPLHYAALAGSVEVLEALLELRADVRRRTSKDEPALGLPPWMSALDLAVCYKHHETTRLLLAARAHLEGGTAPAMHYAAISNNAEGVRLLCAAGGRPLAQNLLGFTALQAAATYAAMEAVEMLVQDVQGCPALELSRALWGAAAFRGGSAELVRRLLNLRADVNFQFSVPRDLRPLGRIFCATKSLQHRLGWATLQTQFFYHQNGSTPLMQSIQTAQWEAAAALIAAGARIDLRNTRNRAAADFARGQSIPYYLQMGLDGDAAQCSRVSSLALADGYVEVYMQLGAVCEAFESAFVHFGVLSFRIPKVQVAFSRGFKSSQGKLHHGLPQVFLSLRMKSCVLYQTFELDAAPHPITIPRYGNSSLPSTGSSLQL